MIQRITKSLLVAALLIGVTHATPSVCVGWSLNPFASNDKQTTRSYYPTSATKKAPSALDKLTTGTKNFVNKTGETLGLKKKPPKAPAPQFAYAKPRTIQPPAKQSKSWYSFLSPEEKRPKKVEDWMGGTTQITP